MIAAAKTVLQDVCKALGITGPVRRLVIDLDAKSPALIYIQRCLHEEEVKPLMDALTSDTPHTIDFREVRSVEVSETGEVRTDG